MIDNSELPEGVNVGEVTSLSAVGSPLAQGVLYW